MKRQNLDPSQLVFNGLLAEAAVANKAALRARQRSRLCEAAAEAMPLFGSCEECSSPPR